MSSRAERWEAIFAGDRDPWNFWHEPFEQEKFRACARMLPRTYDAALELGCAGGAFTRHLAGHCETVLALDVSEAALAQARRRLSLPRVAFMRAELPREWPDGRFDLIVFSEILYYFTRAEIAVLARRAELSLRPGGNVLLVNWLGETGEPLSGSEAAEFFLAACSEDIRPCAGDPAPSTGYRVDLLQKTLHSEDR